MTTVSAPPTTSPETTERLDHQASRFLEPFTIEKTVERVGQGAVDKMRHPATHLLRSLVGGVMVAFGVLLSIMLGSGITVPGLSAALMGLAFGPSFVLICVSGMSLITADMASGIIPVLDRVITPLQYLRFLMVGLVGNLAGVFGFVTIAAAAGGPYLSPAFVAQTVKVGLAKSGEHLVGALLLGVLCTWFLQTAMFMYYKARTDIARMAFAFYGPFAFVAGGTQHVIANIGFIGLPWLLHLFHPGAVPATAITWGFGGHGMARNLLTSFIGNWVGGAILVAIPFYLIARQEAALGAHDLTAVRRWSLPRTEDV